MIIFDSGHSSFLVTHVIQTLIGSWRYVVLFQLTTAVRSLDVFPMNYPAPMSRLNFKRYRPSHLYDQPRQGLVEYFWCQEFHLKETIMQLRFTNSYVEIIYEIVYSPVQTSSEKKNIKLQFHSQRETRLLPVVWFFKARILLCSNGRILMKEALADRIYEKTIRAKALSRLADP